MSELVRETAPDEDWDRLRPVLEDAMHDLAEKDRLAVLLRYFQNKPLKEVGAVLGLNENAARMRVDRALDKLRGLLSQRGVTLSVAGLGAALVGNTVQAAPVGLAVTIATATGLAGTTIATTATATAAKALAMTTTQKFLVAIIVAASVMTPVLVQHRAQTKQAEQDRALGRQADQMAELQKANERLANLLAEANRSRALSISQFNELLRLRGQVSRLNREVEELAQLITANSANAIDVLAATKYARDHEGRFPSSVDEVAADLRKLKMPLSGTNRFDIVFHGSIGELKGIPRGAVAVIRDRQTWTAPSGKQARVYGLADGTSLIVESDDDFRAWEAEHIISTAPAAQ